MFRPLKKNIQLVTLSLYACVYVRKKNKLASIHYIVLYIPNKFILHIEIMVMFFSKGNEC